MLHKDFRGYLAKLEEIGDLKRVKAEVDWNEELGGIAFEGLARRSPALLFESVKDYHGTHGQKVIANFIESANRGKVALGLPPSTPQPEVINILRDRMRKPIKPTSVSDGACKEVVEMGKSVNLLEFPVPKIHNLDGGCYLMTWSNVITKDPDSSWINVGTYRGMVRNENSLGMLIEPQHHGRVHMRQWREAGHRLCPWPWPLEWIPFA